MIYNYIILLMYHIYLKSNLNLTIMKKIILLMSIVFLYSCNNTNTVGEVESSNNNYARNLESAQNFMKLHEMEDLESQIAMLSDDLIHEPPRYGAELQDKDGFINDVKGYQDNFENMKFTPTYWLPGSDSLGNMNGSVRVYGVWTATHTPTQKSINLKSYHYWDFDDGGLIIQAGDYFDATGMMMSLASDE